VLTEEVVRVAVVALFATITFCVSWFLPLARAVLIQRFEVSILVAVVGLAFALVMGSGVACLILVKQLRVLSLLAATDDLTNVFNSRELSRRLEEEVARVKRHKREFCFILIDIDRLKNANDRYGYDVGDQLLREFAQYAKSQLRVSDVLGRYRQGDEFAIIAVDTAPLGGRILAERLRAGIEQYKFQGAGKTHSFSITFSAGVAGSDQAGGSSETVQKCAQVALAEAKRTRNSVVVFSGKMADSLSTMGK
jgi:diguanylate cyclase (GGDEF)-like protein